MSKKTKLITEVDMERLSSILNDRVKDRLSASRLEELLAGLEVIDSSEAPSDLVTMNSMVRGVVQSGGDEQPEVRTVTLVYPRAANIAEGCISVLTPFGMRLLGSRKGEVIDWQGHDGSTRKMVLEDVVYQPEASGDWHL